MPQSDVSYPDMPRPGLADPVLTVIVISYNTRALTLAALATLFAQTRATPIHVVVFDNASTDGSPQAIATAFPQVELIRSPDNLGFARANNVVAQKARTDWLLLLNPDTEVQDGAVDRLMAFARDHLDAGIWGGRTVFADGRLNIASCWMRITPWSVFCLTTGLSGLFSRSELFNPEAMGDWQRDSIRQVDIVVGCFLLIRRALWDRLGGFDLKYFMYGEEADLCLRAAAMGHAPMITPDAQIMHIVGAATHGRPGHKLVQVARARATLIRDHWPGWQVPLGLGMMWAGAGARRGLLGAMGRLKGGRWQDRAAAHRLVWQERATWLKGY